MISLTTGQNAVLDHDALEIRLDPARPIAGAMTGVALLLDEAERVPGPEGYVGDARPRTGDDTVAFDAQAGLFRVDLARLPAAVARVRIGMALRGGPSAGYSVANLDRVSTTVAGRGGAVLADYHLALDGRTETALFLIDLYRRHGAWRVKAVGQGFVWGLNALGRAHGLDIVEGADGQILVRGEGDPGPGPGPGPVPPGDAPHPGHRRPQPGDRFTGTGFAVSPDGYFLTNEHVVRDCHRFAAASALDQFDLRVVFADPVNDLALMKADRPADGVVRFRDPIAIAPGEDVVTLGFPLSGLLGANPQVTTGAVSALSGTANDTRLVQFTAPIQSGNSGGPLFDGHGLVIGVISAKLNAESVHRLTGDIPQNVNFAIKAAVARSFLDAAGLAPVLATPQGSAPAASAVAAEARRHVVKILAEA